jgi:hypothetical protein
VQILIIIPIAEDRCRNSYSHIEILPQSSPPFFELCYIIAPLPLAKMDQILLASLSALRSFAKLVTSLGFSPSLVLGFFLVLALVFLSSWSRSRLGLLLVLVLVLVLVYLSSPVSVSCSISLIIFIFIYRPAFLYYHDY